MSEKELGRHLISKSLPDTIRQTLIQALDGKGELLVLVSPDADFQTHLIQSIANEWRLCSGQAYHVHCPQEPELSFYNSWRLMWRLFFGLTENDSKSQISRKIEQQVAALCPGADETLAVLQRLLIPQAEQLRQALLDHWRETRGTWDLLDREAEKLGTLPAERSVTAEEQGRYEHWGAAAVGAGRQGGRALLREIGVAVDELAEATIGILGAAAREVPLLIAFDGIHRMGVPSLDLLVSVAQQVTTLPLLLIASHRDTVDSSPYPSALHVLHDLKQVTVVSV